MSKSIENFCRCQKHSHAEHSVSNFVFWAKFLFYLKKRGNFGHFFKLNFLDFIKQKLRPQSKILDTDPSI